MTSNLVRTFLLYQIDCLFVFIEQPVKNALVDAQAVFRLKQQQ